MLGLGLGTEPAEEDTMRRPPRWQTMIFATIGFAQIFQALALRSPAHSPFSLWTNPLMAWVVVATVLLQLAVIYLPFMETFFELVPLSLENL